MSIILNREELLQENSELRGKALDILEAGFQAINTKKILRNKIRLEDSTLDIGGNKYDLSSYEKIFFVGIGKCALEGAEVVENILGDYLTDGIALGVIADSAEGLIVPKKIRSYVGTHPYPSPQNVEVTKKILEMVKELTEKDLVITLISGGGSSLFELPMPGVTLETIIEKTKELTARGADIYELNEVRKSMSQVKGGKFATLCQPAQVVSLIFSDVLGNDISVIASGPTVVELPSPNLGEGLGGEVRVKNILVSSNIDALEAMESKAEELGFGAIIETERLSGNASEIGKELARREPKPNTCVLFGGETTVIIKEDHGEGGRNQEMALSALLSIKPDSILVCSSSDGFDNTPHAGAIVDTLLLQKTKELGINPEEYLEKSDSYNFFKKVGGALYTGKLGSNVSDLCILIYK